MTTLCRIVFTIGAAALMVTPFDANAGQIFTPTDDTYVDMRCTDCNNGSGESMTVMNRYGHPTHPENWQKDTLVRFDLSSIPPGSEITSATLYLYYYHYHDNNPAGRNLTCYRITGDWDEMTVTWDTQPGHHTEVTDSATVPGYYTWMDWDVTGDVQDFVDEVQMNYGWQIKDEVPWEWYDIPRTYYRTKEFGDFIPYLEVTCEATPTRSCTWGSIRGLFR